MKIITKILIWIAVVTSATFVQAKEDQSNNDAKNSFRGLFIFGADFGGDALVNVTYFTAVRFIS